MGLPISAVLCALQPIHTNDAIHVFTYIQCCHMLFLLLREKKNPQYCELIKSKIIWKEFKWRCSITCTRLVAFPATTKNTTFFSLVPIFRILYFYNPILSRHKDERRLVVWLQISDGCVSTAVFSASVQVIGKCENYNQTLVILLTQVTRAFKWKTHLSTFMLSGERNYPTWAWCKLPYVRYLSDEQN